jgi:D-alanyl-D-alanine carboxypeptidase
LFIGRTHCAQQDCNRKIRMAKIAASVAGRTRFAICLSHFRLSLTDSDMTVPMRHMRNPSKRTARFFQLFARRGLAVLIGVATALTMLTIEHADARAKKRVNPHRVVHGRNYHPPYAAIVVDVNSGQVLHQANCDEPRHPASLTKIMTLYLLFEQLQSGEIRLDSQLPISAHAAVQAPTKLGLRAGNTLKVEDAIYGIVTRSANDAAVVVAEAVGGTEDDFARLMTRKARALGMMNTVYVNASGLPADAQLTTARDQAVLGRAIQTRFPDYYGYFATPRFVYRGRPIANHNKLLGSVEGVDGIKTGYTQASGYNLVSSVRRDQRHMVAVVLGGTSNGARDARMRQLIEQHIGRASTQRTAPAIIEAVQRTAPAIIEAKGITVDGAAPSPPATGLGPATQRAIGGASQPPAATGESYLLASAAMRSASVPGRTADGEAIPSHSGVRPLRPVTASPFEGAP